MNNKICGILIEMFAVMALASACSGRHEVEDVENAPESAVIETVDPGSVTPDLNRNGKAEEVRLTDLDDGQGQRLEIWEEDVLVCQKDGYFAHTGQNSIFLCTLDGEDYLLCYRPTMYQGVCTYEYVLSTLADNKEKTVRFERVDFDINFGSPVHDGFDAQAIAAFMDEINDLLSHSVQLLNTDSDLQGTFEREERLYDSLWWMDSQEPPVFARDESKSLLENLEEYQKAMTAAQEPVVVGEQDALPVTEPLEMAFYSGAWAFPWMHDRHGFDSETDILGCWGLQNLVSGREALQIRMNRKEC